MALRPCRGGGRLEVVRLERIVLDSTSSASSGGDSGCRSSAMHWSVLPNGIGGST